MEPSEYVEDFLNLFIHIYEFPEGVVKSYIIMENFQSLILLFLKYLESKPLDNSLSPNIANHGTPQSSKEEPTIPCPPHFLVRIWVPLGNDVKFGKYENQIVDLSIQSPSTSYTPLPIEENLE